MAAQILTINFANRAKIQYYMINGQSQFTAATSDTNILKSWPICTRNKPRREVSSHQKKREKVTTREARCGFLGGLLICDTWFRI